MVLPELLEEEVADGIVLAAALPLPGATLPESSDESEGPLDLGSSVQSRCPLGDDDGPIEFAGTTGTIGFNVLDAPAESDLDGGSCVLPLPGTPDSSADDLASGSWTPGIDVGDLMNAQRPLCEQGQALAVNVFLVAKRLPQQLLSALAAHFRRSGHESRPLRVAASFLCVSRWFLNRTVLAVTTNRWAPVPPITRNRLAEDGQNGIHSDADQLRVLTTLVRAALSLGDEGYRSFTLHLARLQLAGVDVGNRCHGRHFAQEAVFLAARCVQAMDASDLRTALPGLGVRSSLALLMDGVPVAGMAAYGRHGSVSVICVNSISHRDGKLRPRMLCWAISARGHGGEATASAVLEALSQPPLRISPGELRQCLSLVGGDGASVRGGADRKSPSTQAGEILWRKVYGHLVDELRDLGDDAPLRALAADLPRPPAERDAWLLDDSKLHAATEWDKFHREDIALSRAVAATPLAEELFSVCQLMDQWFNLGDGRLLAKRAATVLGIRLRSGALPGNTRKVVVLAREPAHLLDNFPAYALGIHGRTAHRRGGHAGPTLAALVEGGRRLVSLDLIAFAALFKDLMGGIVAPWALAIQCSSVEPWALRRVQLDHEAALKSARDCLVCLRDLLRIIMLLRPYLHQRDLRSFVEAWFYGTAAQFRSGIAGACLGRLFPTFLYSLKKFLLFDAEFGQGRASFRGVPLAAVPMQDPDVWSCISPQCQCVYQEQAAASRLTRAPFPNYMGSLPVPHWVGASGLPRTQWAAQCAHTPLRYLHRKTADLHIAGRLRPSPACLTSWAFVAAFEDIDAALSSARHFVDELVQQHTKLFGGEGCSAGMRRVLDAMATTFDWGRVAVQLPTPESVQEFAVLARMLMPYLRHLEFPSPDEFPSVQHCWPSIPELQVQYVLLCRRIRSYPHPPWWVYTGASVEPLEASELSLWFVAQVIEPRAFSQEQPRLHVGLGLPPSAEGPLSRALLAHVATVISRCLGQTPDRHFDVSVAGLAFVGYPWRGRKQPHRMRSSVSKVWKCRLGQALPGGVVALTSPGMAGKLAYVRTVHRKLDWSLVSAKVDTDPFFSRDGVGRSQSGGNAWHAVRIHNFCRPMGSPEAVCERVGSLMHMQYSATRHLQAGALMDEVLLRDAQVLCLGHGRDERIVKEVAECMLALGRRPLVMNQQRYGPAGYALQRTRALHRQRVADSGRAPEEECSSSDGSSGSDGGGFLDEYSFSSELTSAMGVRVQRATPESADVSVRASLQQSWHAGQVQQLPLFPEDVRTSSARRADSTKRSALQDWLTSPSGIAWTDVKRRRRSA